MAETDNMEARYEKNPDFVFREIEGEIILVPVRDRTADFESIYTLNPTGARIWELLDGERALDEIHAVLAEEYEVTPQEAEADLVEFIAYLEEIDAVRRT